MSDPTAAPADAGAIRTGAILEYPARPKFEDEDENEAPCEGASHKRGRLERVANAPIYLHEIVSGAVDEVIIGFAKYADVRCKPVF